MMPATSSGFWAIGLPSAAPSSAGLSMVNASPWSTNINRWCFRYIHRFVSSHRWLFDPSTFRCHMEISRKYPKIASYTLTWSWHSCLGSAEILAMSSSQVRFDSPFYPFWVKPKRPRLHQAERLPLVFRTFFDHSPHPAAWTRGRNNATWGETTNP